MDRKGTHLFLVVLAFFIAIMTAIGLIILGAYILMRQVNPPIKKPVSCGYEVIANGLGIDCNGDTIKLEKNPPHGWRRKKQ